MRAPARQPPSTDCIGIQTEGRTTCLSSLTFFHWLLVFIGCWQEIWWFMFDAGHSHTEIADRLFETDSSASVQGGIFSFEELEDRSKETFQKCPELKEIVYHFAN